MDKLHDIPKAFPDPDRKVRPQTKEERKESLKKLLDAMLFFNDINQEEYKKMYKKGVKDIEEEFSTK